QPPHLAALFKAAAVLVGGPRRCRHGAVPHVRAAARHLDTLRHMAGARPRCLCALRKQPQPDWTNRHSPVPLIAGQSTSPDCILSPPAPLCGAIDAAYLPPTLADATAS